MSNSASEKKVYQILHLLSESDSDIIEKLNSVENKTEYIRQLIRADIKEEKIKQ